MRIGIFGGTFDPIHKGHLALALAAKEQARLDKVLFIPANIPPHKTDRCEEMRSAEDRYRMVSLACQGYPGLEASRTEIDRGGISYTIDTLQEIQKVQPDAEIFLILGEDNLKGLSSWHRAEELLCMAHFLVARRYGGKPKEIQGAAITWLKMPEYPYASSEIRGRIERGEIPAEALPEAVAEYIRTKQLYRCNT